ncbi:TRAF3-interacting protein 1 [Trichonephila clavata]|uniref:TRAF3-interacting protein 1 n=2 Tax=Trichonephila clavata TaxID=2740835 RepID=A0A8X6GZB1_TRICU|nr:TRAF3-interacting protein 1 [Trichonephila clavata]
MADEIDPDIIKKTQEILGGVIKKPPLTEKSLKKPPFRFLYDIITNIIKTTGFYKGLYTPTELQSDNVKDRETKILFLQKAIDVLALVTNQPINLKPAKVVAGHEPQKTNLFLQILGTAIKSKLDSKDAVEKVLSGKGQTSPTKALKERRASVDRRSKGSNEKSHSRSLTKTLEPVKNKDSSKSKDGEKSKERSKKEREKSRERTKHKLEDSKKEKPKEKASKPKEPPPENDVEDQPKEETIEINDVENHVPVPTDDPEPSTSMMNGDAHDKEKVLENEIGDSPVNEKPVREKSHRPHSSRSARPPSARSKRTKPKEEDNPIMEITREPVMVTQTPNSPVKAEQNFENMLLPSFRPPSARPPSARPSSSRPAPPRIRIRHVVENQEPVLRPTTAKPVENVILDQGHQSDEEEETFLVMESEAPEQLEVQSSNSMPAETPDEDKGSLVKKLLETKKDLEGGSQHTPTKKVEIDRSQMSQTERHSASKELAQLRNYVQSLSKTAVPLGRMLDFLQEDLDSMKMELRMWKDEHEQNLIALHKEQSATETLLEPLRAQLDDLDQVVQNQLDANSALKASITRNDERIQRMLSSVNHKS